MKKLFKQFNAAELAAVMTVALAACSDGDSTTGNPSVDNQVEQTMAADGGKMAGGQLGVKKLSGDAPTSLLKMPESWTGKNTTETVIYQSSSAISSLDEWSQSAGGATFTMDYLIFDGLVNKDEEGNLILQLAEFWDMAKDYTNITLHLRGGIYFTNGIQMTADDVIFPFERLRDNKEYLPDSSAKSWRNYIGELEEIDDFNFVLNFSAPMSKFWTLMDTPSVQIICEEAFESTPYEEFWRNPVGNGPYVMTSFDGVSLIIEFDLRTDEHGYWEYDYADRYTDVKHVTFQYPPEDTTRVSSLRTGKTNVTNNVPTTNVEPLSLEGCRTGSLVPTTYIFLQVSYEPDNPFNNRDLREALSLCIDRQLIVDALLDGYGRACAYPSLGRGLGCRESPRYKYNLERTKELVQSSGYNGETLKFVYTASTVSITTELCQAIQSIATSAGLNVEVVPLEVTVYNDTRMNRDYDICPASIGKNGNMWFKAAAEVVGNDRFNTGLDNEELMTLRVQMQFKMDVETQDKILAEVYEMGLKEFKPSLYLYWPTTIYSQDSNIHGISSHGHKIGDLSTMVWNKQADKRRE